MLGVVFDGRCNSNSAVRSQTPVGGHIDDSESAPCQRAGLVEHGGREGARLIKATSVAEE